MELKSKYNIGQLLKTKHTYEDANAQLHNESIISAVKQIIWDGNAVIYKLENLIEVVQEDILASFSQDVVAVKKTRVRKKKTAPIALNHNGVIFNESEGSSFA